MRISLSFARTSLSNSRAYALRRSGGAVMQFLAQEQGQLLKLGRRDHRLSHGKAASEVSDLLHELIPPEPQADQTLAH